MIIKKVTFSTLLTLGVLLSSGYVAKAAPDTCTWTGAGTNTNFSTAANWSGCDAGNIPENGDALIFPSSVATDKRIANNDLTSLSLSGIIFSGTHTTGTFNMYSVRGNPITLSGNIVNSSDYSAEIQNSLILSTNITINSATSRLILGTSGSVETLNTQTFSLTLAGNSDSATSINLGLRGSGSVIAGSKKQQINSSGTGFTGAVTVPAGSGLALAKNDALGTTSGVTVSSGAELVLVSTQDTSFNFPLTIGGVGLTDGAYNGAIRTAIFGYTGGGGGVDSVFKITLPGSVTLTSNTIFHGDLNLTIVGTYTPGSYTFTTRSGSTGTLTTPQGVSEAPTVISTIESTDKDPAKSESILNKQTIVLKGERGGITVLFGGTLKGTGIMKDLYVYTGGILAPGLSPGCLTSGNLQLNGTYVVELGGLKVCEQYDQTKVIGTVNLSGATLVIQRINNMVPRLNDTFVIIDNDGSDQVSGTFAGLAQGATTVVAGVTYTITYKGGDGNDIALVVTNVDKSLGAPNTGFKVMQSSVILPLIAIGSGVVLAAASAKYKRR